MSTEIRLSLDTRAFLVAGAAAGAAFALYCYTQSKGYPTLARTGKQDEKADPSTTDPAHAACQHAQRLQLHYASGLTPALSSVGTDSQSKALVEVPGISHPRSLHLRKHTELTVAPAPIIRQHGVLTSDLVQRTCKLCIMDAVASGATFCYPSYPRGSPCLI